MKRPCLFLVFSFFLLFSAPTWGAGSDDVQINLDVLDQFSAPPVSPLPPSPPKLEPKPKAPAAAPVKNVTKTPLEKPAIKKQNLPEKKTVEKDIIPSSPSISASLLYLPDSTIPTADQKRDLGEKIIPMLLDNPNTRLEIHASAFIEKAKKGTLRRLSLSRALALKDFLASQGIPEERIDIFPMGDTGENGLKNQVDCLVRFL